MKVACISYFAPDKENNKGPKSLLYQLIANRRKDILIDLYLPDKTYDEIKKSASFIENALDIVICPLKCSRPNRLKRLYTAWWPKGAKICMEIDVTKFEKYDLIWGYPFWTAPHFRNAMKKVLITGMDSATLLYYRKVKSCIKDLSWKVLIYVPALIRIILFEKMYLKSKTVHVVGQADNKVMRFFNINSFYIPHPANPMILNNYEKLRSQDLIRVLVSNALDPFYGSKTVLKWLNVIFEVAPKFPSKTFEIIFHKGDQARIQNWLSKQILPNSVVISYVGWVENYEELLSGIDIQIFPLDVGAGTKTSVLTALNMGVTCIGTSIAFENIRTNSSELFLCADSTSDFIRKFISAVAKLCKHPNCPRYSALGHEHQPSQSVANFWNTIIKKL